MKSSTFKLWRWLHKWSSLVCTLFLFLLCLTGLPLIFHHEIDHALGHRIEAPPLPDPAAKASHTSVNEIVHNALAHRPNEVVQYVIWELGETDTVQVIMAAAPNTPPDDSHTVIVDARTAQVLGESHFDRTVMFVLLKLHTDLCLGLKGKWFLGAMGLLFVISLVSGAVIYAPLMRKIRFGEIRRHKNRRAQYLDLHNLIGISTLAWALVVCGTGVITSLADVAVNSWRQQQINALMAQYQQPSVPAPSPFTDRHADLNAMLQTASAHAPDMTPNFIAFPNTNFSTHYHVTIFMRGKTALTAYLWQPILIDAQNGQFIDSRQLPWYLTAVLVAKPLHFGDYAGLPLKILWGILDFLTLVVLGSGLYLWLKKYRKKSI